MEFYLDTANVDAIKRLSRVLPVHGVTTNPSIIAKEKKSIWQLLPAVHEALEGKGLLFAQTMAPDAKGMVVDALKLRKCIPDLVVKIPVTPEGIAAIKELKQEGVPTLGTAVYGATQGFLAALAGAEYIAPYVNRLDAQGGSGIELVDELQQLLDLHAPDAKVLAASFRTPRQVLDCMLAGCKSVTVPVDVAELFLAAPAVQVAVEKFEQDWQAAFDNTAL